MKKNSFKAFLLLAFTTWVAHFFYFEKFGFYFDDYPNIPPHLGQSLSYIIEHIEFHSTHWWHGRPLAFLPGLFTFIGGQLADGLPILYVIAFIILTVNSFLMYKVLKVVFPESELFAITGALAFCLFPPDTTKIFLLHAYYLQISLMFLLIASLLYLKGWRKVSYLVILMTLLSYETTFMVFFGVPLLKGKWDKKFRWEFIRHILILIFMIAIIFLYRKSIGEYRVATETEDISGLVEKVILSLFIGPAIDLFLFFRAPVIAINDWMMLKISHWYENILLFLSVCSMVFIWIFYKLKPENRLFINSQESLVESNKESLENNNTIKYFTKIYKIFIAAVIMIGLAYVFAFTHYPPTTQIGPLTSVHLAATFGGSIIVACICSSIVFIANKYRFKVVAIVIIAVYLSLLVGYRMRIQRDFADSWEDQRSFWPKVIELCPDMKENTMIFVLNGANNRWLRFTNYIYTYTWADRLVLQHLFKFPSNWKSAPRLQVVHSNLTNHVNLMNDKLKCRFDPIPTWETMPDSNVIILQLDKNLNLSRMDSLFINIKGKKLYLKPREPDVLPSLEKGVLYDILIKPDS